MECRFFEKKYAIAFTSSASTAVDTTIVASDRGRIIGALIKGHTWNGSGTFAGGASSCSGAHVTIRDPDGNTLLSFAEVLTGSTTRITLANTTSADGLMIAGGIVRYAMGDYIRDNRCTSGVGTPASQYPVATVILYLEK